ncbi:MAG: type II secretion system protein [Planctomycetaceae bacterium]
MRKSGADSGMTLLEVVIALMLFALMCALLLGGQGQAAESILKAETERSLAYLLPLRLNLIALQPEDYKDGEEGGFPAVGKSSRLLDEEKVFGDRFKDYRWRVEIIEAVGAGQTSPVRVEGRDAIAPLFGEESAAAARPEDRSANDITDVKPEDVDRIRFIRVTVYPPGYEEGENPDDPGVVQPRAAWTGVAIPEGEESTK